MAHGAGGDNHVVALDRQGDAAAGTHSDKGICPDGGKLLHGDDGRGAADTGGAHRNLFSQQLAGIGGIFPVGLYLHRVVKIGRDFFAAARVAGQDAVPAHVPRGAFDMKLLLMLVHGLTSKICGHAAVRLILYVSL